MTNCTSSSDNGHCEQRCPLCGQTNGCAMAREHQSGQSQAPCWCVDLRFSPQLLARVPEAARNKACICQACVAASQSAENTPKT